MHRVPSGSALAIATGLQTAVVLRLTDHPWLAIWVAAAAIAVFVWQWTHRWSKVLLVIANAIMLSIPARLYFGSPGDGSEGSGYGDTPSQGDHPKSDESKRNSGDRNTIAVDNTFPGVILFPEVQKHVTIVPPLPAMRGDLFSPRNPNPLSIPFFGSYWFYKWPQRRLPKDAITERGDPDDKRFRSTDGNALTMEAHQNLGTFIELTCCSAIEIAIRSADRYPGSVSVNLQLVNTLLPGSPSFSLGTLPVTSFPHWQPGSIGKTAEILSFPIPVSRPFPRFDEFSVKFILSYVRRDHSAAIAIERFTLIPRRGVR